MQTLPGKWQEHFSNPDHNKKKSLDNLFIEAFLFVPHSRSISHSSLTFLFQSEKRI